MRRNRLIQSASKVSHFYDAINTSQNLLPSLRSESGNKSLCRDIERDIKVMRAKMIRHESMFLSAKRLTTSRRCARKRKKHDRTNEKYFNILIGRRRRNRIEDRERINYNLSAIDSELEEFLEIGSNTPVDSEAEDETYIPEVFIKKRRKRKKSRGKHRWKRGNNESAIADINDIFAEEYDHVMNQYQFALDLKKRDPNSGTHMILVCLLL